MRVRLGLSSVVRLFGPLRMVGMLGVIGTLGIFGMLSMFVMLGLTACVTSPLQRMATGVERFDSTDGSIRLVATAMASDNAISKDSAAMMQATSKEAARLLLVAEMERPQYARLKEKFEITDAEFIDRGRYCRLVAVYRPPQPLPSSTKKQEPKTP